MKSKRKKFQRGDNRRVTSVLTVKFGPDFESISCNKRLTAIRHNFAKVPTIVINGGASFPFLRATADAIAKILPKEQRHTLEGQTHNVAPEAIAPVLREFFSR